MAAVTLDNAELPSPAERLKGDWRDFYDPTKGSRRIYFCTYYAAVTAGLITRLAQALKDGSDGRFLKEVHRVEEEDSSELDSHLRLLRVDPGTRRNKLHAFSFSLSRRKNK